MSRDELHRLVDTLPEGALENAKQVLEHMQVLPPQTPPEVERMRQQHLERMRHSMRPGTSGTGGGGGSYTVGSGGKVEAGAFSFIAPGFIDVHTHSDQEVLEGRTNKILQGVTTEIVGNCSYSLFPAHPDPACRHAASIFEDVPLPAMNTAQDYFRALETARPLLNVASLTGHSAIRNYVIGMSRRPPAAREQMAMEALLDRCLEEGSIGFSTGLNCLPSSFAAFEELAALCRVLKRHGAYYATHMRDYKFRVVEAVEEAIRLAEVSETAVQLSHVQVVGKKSWRHLDTILSLASEAAQRGVDIGMDAYPYLAGSCSLVQFLPEWCQASSYGDTSSRTTSSNSDACSTTRLLARSQAA
jgi:N-acyl-D-aspartate/D-glutamate deacylase